MLDNNSVCSLMSLMLNIQIGLKATFHKIQQIVKNSLTVNNNIVCKCNKSINTEQLFRMSIVEDQYWKVHLHLICKKVH